MVPVQTMFVLKKGTPKWTIYNTTYIIGKFWNIWIYLAFAAFDIGLLMPAIMLCLSRLDRFLLWIPRSRMEAWDFDGNWAPNSQTMRNHCLECSSGSPLVSKVASQKVVQYTTFAVLGNDWPWLAPVITNHSMARPSDGHWKVWGSSAAGCLVDHPRLSTPAVTPSLFLCGCPMPETHDSPVWTTSITHKQLVSSESGRALLSCS